MCAVLERVNPEDEKKPADTKAMLEKILANQTPQKETNFVSANKYQALEETDCDQGIPLADPGWSRPAGRSSRETLK